MPVIRGQALLQRARPAKPPKPGRDLEVIQVGTTAAAGADELIHVVVAALDTAVHDAGRLVPQERRGAVAGLPGQRRPGDAVGSGTHPRVTAIMGAWCGGGRRMCNRFGTGHEVRGAKTAHSAHRQVVVPPATGVWSSDTAYDQTLTCRRCAANAVRVRSGLITWRQGLSFPGRSPRRGNVIAVFLRVSGHSSQVAGTAQVTGAFTALADYSRAAS